MQLLFLMLSTFGCIYEFLACMNPSEIFMRFVLKLFQAYLWRCLQGFMRIFSATYKKIFENSFRNYFGNLLKNSAHDCSWTTSSIFRFFRIYLKTLPSTYMASTYSIRDFPRHSSKTILLKIPFGIPLFIILRRISRLHQRRILSLFRFGYLFGFFFHRICFKILFLRLNFYLHCNSNCNCPVKSFRNSSVTIQRNSERS